jgi:gamma-glutamyltranspeptidase/glutathione hydrolase
MAPALKLARDGYPLSWQDAQDFHEGDLTKFSKSQRVFPRNGNYYNQGEVFRQPKLARTLKRIASNPDDFYHGAMARELAASPLSAMTPTIVLKDGKLLPL